LTAEPAPGAGDAAPSISRVPDTRMRVCTTSKPPPPDERDDEAFDRKFNGRLVRRAAERAGA